MQLSGKQRHQICLLLTTMFYATCALLAALQILAHRFEYYSVDAINYLDSADFFRRFDFASGFTTYWSPLYASVIALTGAMIPLPAYWEIVLLRVTNLIIFIFLLFCFRVFLRNFLYFYYRSIKSTHLKHVRIERWMWLAIIYPLFIWAFLGLGGIEQDTPDFLADCFLLLSLAFTLLIQAGRKRTRYFLILGALLGISYYAKAFCLPLALVFYCVLLIGAPSFDRIKKTALCLSITLLLAAPLIYLMSKEQHTLSFSPVGRINYLWTIRRELTSVQQIMESQLHIRLPHVPEKIFSQPDAYYFNYPRAVTYPFTYDFGYWFVGVPVSFCLMCTVVSSICNIVGCLNTFLASFICALVLLLVLAGKELTTKKSLQDNLPFFAIAAAIAVGHTVVLNMLLTRQVERYFMLTLLLLYIGLFSSLRLPISSRSKRALALEIGLVFILCLAGTAAKAVSTGQALTSADQYPYATIAMALSREALRPGDKIARLGEVEFAHFGRLPRLKTIVDVPDAEQFFQASPSRQEELLTTLKSYGVKAIIYFSEPCQRATVEWRKAQIESREKIAQLVHGQTSLKYSYTPPPASVLANGWKHVAGTSCYYRILE